MAKIIKCNCEHEGQDKMYGKGNRVANEVVSKSGTKKIYRCTVCGKEK